MSDIVFENEATAPASVLIEFCTFRSSSDTVEEAITEAKETDTHRKASGFDQAALDDVARAGFGNGAFEDSEEEIPAIVEEFYAEGEATGQPATSPATTLKDKLDRKAAVQTGGEA